MTTPFAHALLRTCMLAIALVALGCLGPSAPLSAPGARMRFYAPSLRNMLDRDCPLASFAASIDVLSGNRQEWEALDDREEVEGSEQRV